MARVWRVQNQLGGGPYSSKSYPSGVKPADAEEMSRNHSDLLHPNPWEDGLNRDLFPEERCCFLTKRQAKAWFTAGELVMLERHGFTLQRVTGRITSRLENQGLFIPADS